MARSQAHPQTVLGIRRRTVLKAGLAASVALSTGPLLHTSALWGAEAGSPKRGGVLRVRGYDPVHFDPHQTISFKTHTTLSFVYSKLVRHQVGPEVRPGTFIVEPDLAERWEALDETTYVFHLRQGVKWHPKSPLNGRELVTKALDAEFGKGKTGSFDPETGIKSSEFVGPSVGGDLRKQAVMATLYALGGILVYIAFRFEWIYGAAAVFAVLAAVCACPAAALAACAF